MKNLLTLDLFSCTTALNVLQQNCHRHQHQHRACHRTAFRITTEQHQSLHPVPIQYEFHSEQIYPKVIANHLYSHHREMAGVETKWLIYGG